MRSHGRALSKTSQPFGLSSLRRGVHCSRIAVDTSSKSPAYVLLMDLIINVCHRARSPGEHRARGILMKGRALQCKQLRCRWPVSGPHIPLHASIMPAEPADGGPSRRGIIMNWRKSLDSCREVLLHETTELPGNSPDGDALADHVCPHQPARSRIGRFSRDAAR